LWFFFGLAVSHTSLLLLDSWTKAGRPLIASKSILQGGNGGYFNRIPIEIFYSLGSTADKSTELSAKRIELVENMQNQIRLDAPTLDNL
jgi:hypothetical protein